MTTPCIEPAQTDCTEELPTTALPRMELGYPRQEPSYGGQLPSFCNPNILTGGGGIGPTCDGFSAGYGLDQYFAQPAPELGPRDLTLVQEHSDRLAAISELEGEERGAAYDALREELGANPMMMSAMALTDGDIRALIESGMSYHLGPDGRSDEVVDGQAVPHDHHRSSGRTDYAESVDLLRAVRESGDIILQARFFRQGASFLGGDQRDFDARGELIDDGEDLIDAPRDSTDAQEAAMAEAALREYRAHEEGRDYADYREGLGGLLQDNPREVIRALRSQNTSATLLLEHDREGMAPASDDSGDAMARFLGDAVEDCPRDGFTPALDLAAQVFQGVRNPLGEDDGGARAFVEDPYTAANLGYLTGAADEAVTESEAEDEAVASAVWRLGEALTLGPFGDALKKTGRLGYGSRDLLNQTSASLGDEVIDGIVDLVNDSSEEIGPLRELTLPNRDEARLDPDGNSYESFNQAYDNVAIDR